MRTFDDLEIMQNFKQQREFIHQINDYICIYNFLQSVPEKLYVQTFLCWELKIKREDFCAHKHKFGPLIITKIKQ